MMGAIIGGYIGGSSAEGGELNPHNWSWNGKTWLGVGIGAVIEDYYMNREAYDYNVNIGYQRNDISTSHRYTYFQKEGDHFYMGSMSRRARV